MHQLRERVKIRRTARVVRLDAWREEQHDDLVLAVAIAFWQAARHLEVWVM